MVPMITPPAGFVPGIAAGLHSTIARSSVQLADGVLSYATGSSSKARTSTTRPSAPRYASSCRCALLLLLPTLFFDEFLSCPYDKLSALVN